MCAVLVGDENREPIVEVTEHGEVGWCAHVEPNRVVVERCGAAVGGVDFVGQDDLDAFLGLVSEDRCPILVVARSAIARTRRATSAKGSG